MALASARPEAGYSYSPPSSSYGAPSGGGGGGGFGGGTIKRYQFLVRVTKPMFVLQESVEDSAVAEEEAEVSEEVTTLTLRKRRKIHEKINFQASAEDSVEVAEEEVDSAEVSPFPSN